MAQQHVAFYRKLLLRKQLLRYAGDGPAYVPFIGDGDIAVELYSDRRVFGADLDPDRVPVAEHRLPAADVRVADCDLWPFDGLTDSFAVADFDAYAYPYDSFRAFWHSAAKADRLVLFFTDGQGLNITFKGRWQDPSGPIVTAPGFEIGKEAGDLSVRRPCRSQSLTLLTRQPANPLYQGGDLAPLWSQSFVRR